MTCILALYNDSDPLIAGSIGRKGYLGLHRIVSGIAGAGFNSSVFDRRFSGMRLRL